MRVFGAGYPLTYLRDNRFLVAVNPSREPVTVQVDDDRLAAARPVEDGGARIDGHELTAPSFGYAVFELDRGGRVPSRFGQSMTGQPLRAQAMGGYCFNI